MQRGAVLRALLGSAISVAAIAIVLGSVNLGRVIDVIRGAQASFLLAVVACIGLDLLARAARWQRLVAPIHHVTYERMLDYLLIGYLANNVVPIRLGELIRSHFLGDREGISRTTALGTVVVERIVDTLVVVVIAAVAIVALGVRGAVVTAVWVSVVLVGLLGLLVAGAIVSHRLPVPGFVRTFLDRWPRIQERAGFLRDGLAVAGRPSTLAEALALTVAAWGATLLAFVAAGAALGVDLGLERAALISSGVALAAAVPSGPSSLGTYEAAAVALGTSVGLPGEEALAIAVVVHGITLLMTSIGGLVGLVRVGGLGSTGLIRRAAPASVDPPPPA